MYVMDPRSSPLRRLHLSLELMLYQLSDTHCSIISNRDQVPIMCDKQLSNLLPIMRVNHNEDISCLEQRYHEHSPIIGANHIGRVDSSSFLVSLED